MVRLVGGEYHRPQKGDRYKRGTGTASCPFCTCPPFGVGVNYIRLLGSLEVMKNESELVHRASRGDREAFGQLVERHWARLVRLARSIVGEAEAEDAVQDGLIRAWSKLSQLVNPEAFGYWVSRVVVRVCLRRARASRPGVSLEASPEPRVRTNPGATIDLERLLASLSPRQRAVMHLTVVEGMTDSEIAPCLGISAASVRVHRHRARERLERQMNRRRAA